MENSSAREEKSTLIWLCRDRHKCYCNGYCKTVYIYAEFGLNVLLVDKGRKISKYTYEQNN